MSVLKTSKRRLYKYSIGDLRSRISFFDRSMRPKAFSSSLEEVYDNEVKKWAAIESINPHHFFNEVNIGDKRITHKFVIRYDSDITSEKVIKYNDDIYMIVNIDNPEMRDMFMIIYAHLQGDEDREANQ